MLVVSRKTYCLVSVTGKMPLINLTTVSRTKKLKIQQNTSVFYPIQLNVEVNSVVWHYDSTTVWPEEQEVSTVWLHDDYVDVGDVDVDFHFQRSERARLCHESHECSRMSGMLAKVMNVINECPECFGTFLYINSNIPLPTWMQLTVWFKNNTETSLFSAFAWALSISMSDKILP